MVIFIPNKAGKRNSDDSLIRGELIRNANVFPRGIPALKKPINRGIDEQEQKGVITPRSAANK